MKAIGLLLGATTLGVACSSETARPASLGACVPQKDASCVAPPVAVTTPPGDAGSMPSTAGDGAPSATTRVEGGAGSAAPSGEAGLTPLAPFAEGGVAESGSVANPTGAEAGSPIRTGSE